MLDLWISGTLAGQDVLPSQGWRITIEPGEHTGSATDHSLIGLGVRPMRIPGADEAIEHLARWAGRGRWKEERVRAIPPPFGTEGAKPSISEERLSQPLPHRHYSTLEPF